MLRGLRARYEEFHGVSYTDKALRAAAELSSRYLTDRKLPDKAIDLIDEAGARLKLQGAGPGQDPGARSKRARSARKGAGAEAGKPSVRVKDIEAVVATMARIPPKRVAADDRERLRDLEGDLKGQDLRPGRGGRAGRAGDQDEPRRAGHAQPAHRLFPVRRPHRRRQDRAGQAAGRDPGRRLPPLRHVGVHGAAHGVAPDRRAARLRRLRSGRPADRRHPQDARTRCCCWTRSRRPTRTCSTSCCRSWTTAR